MRIDNPEQLKGIPKEGTVLDEVILRDVPYGSPPVIIGAPEFTFVTSPIRPAGCAYHQFTVVALPNTAREGRRGEIVVEADCDNPWCRPCEPLVINVLQFGNPDVAPAEKEVESAFGGELPASRLDVLEKRVVRLEKKVFPVVWYNPNTTTPHPLGGPLGL